VDIKNAKIGAKTTKIWAREVPGTNLRRFEKVSGLNKEKGLNCKESYTVEGYFCK
jgi:hypothetical protein